MSDLGKKPLLNTLAKKQSRTKRAKLIFPVGRVERQLRKISKTPRLAKTASVYLAGVLEYLSAEITELSGMVAAEDNRKRIIPRHVMLAVDNDEEMKELLKDVTLPYSGVVPAIHSSLLPQRVLKKAKKPKPAESVSLTIHVPNNLIADPVHPGNNPATNAENPDSNDLVDALNAFNNQK